MPGTTVTELEHLDSPLLERQRREALYTSHAVSGAKIRGFIVETAEESTIRGELQVVDLDDADPIPGGFDALSYCWEDKPGIKKPNVFCSHSNVKIPVTPNCISAISHICRLRSRRHRRGKVPPLAIWIDAICINQDDDASEKPQQLSLMGCIYANARETYFWLGPGNNSTVKAMKYLRNGFMPSRDSTPWSNAFRIWWYLFSFHWSQLQPGLEKVFSQDWINRVWTLQECLLSRNGTLVCGNQEAPWLQAAMSIQFAVGTNQKIMPRSPPKNLQFWASLSGFWFDTAAPNKSGTLQAVKREQCFQGEYARYTSKTWNTWRYYQLLRPVSLFPFFGLFGFFGLQSDAMPWLIIPVFLIPFILWAVRLVRVDSSWTTVSRTWIPVLFQESLWHELKRRKCTNPGDKYWGILSLLSVDNSQGTNGENGSVESQPEVQRQLDLGRLYTHLSTELFLKTDSLDQLLIGEYFGPKYASWVINWGPSPHCDPLPEWNIGWMGTRNWTGRRNWIDSALQNLDQRNGAPRWLKWLNFRHYHTYNGFTRFTGATPHSKHQWDEANKTRLRHRRIQDGAESVDLVVQGRIISEISFVKSRGEVFNQYTDHPKCDLEYKSLMAFQESILGLEEDEVDICIKYMLLLVGLNSQVENEYTATFEGIDAWREILREEDRDMRTTRDQLRRKHAAKNIQLGLSLLVHHMDISLARCSGSDYKGFGISTRDAREGDSVALISGVSLPMVVRMNSYGDGKFRVVGPALFGGLMDGKVWRRSVEKGLEEIILC